MLSVKSISFDPVFVSHHSHLNAENQVGLIYSSAFLKKREDILCYIVGRLLVIQ